MGSFLRFWGYLLNHHPMRLGLSPSVSLGITLILSTSPAQGKGQRGTPPHHEAPLLRPHYPRLSPKPEPAKSRDLVRNSVPATSDPCFQASCERWSFFSDLSPNSNPRRQGAESHTKSRCCQSVRPAPLGLQCAALLQHARCASPCRPPAHTTCFPTQ